MEKANYTLYEYTPFFFRHGSVSKKGFFVSLRKTNRGWKYTPMQNENKSYVQIIDSHGL